MSHTLKERAPTAVPTPEPAAFRSADLREEATRVLQHPLFTHSERSSKLLRYLVSVTLKDPSISLKERTVGHDVFGREAGYDTYSDPIVRNAASEVRRRLKQYYESAVGDGPRIDLPPGQYLVVLRTPGHHPLDAGAKESIEEHAAEPVAQKPPAPVTPVSVPAAVARPVEGFNGRRRFLVGLAAAVAAPSLLAGGYALGRRSSVDPPHDGFWDPVLQGAGRVLISLGSRKGVKAADGSEPILVSPSNSTAYARVAALLARSGKPFTMRPDLLTTMSDMRDGTCILIGSFSHVWMRRFSDSLSIRYDQDASGVGWFYDPEHAGQRWSTLVGDKPERTQDDYALVARLRSPITGGTVLLLGGIGSEGANAAAEFLTSRQSLASLSAEMKRPDGNLQMILKTSVVDGVSGPPEIVAQHAW